MKTNVPIEFDALSRPGTDYSHKAGRAVDAELQLFNDLHWLTAESSGLG